MLLLIQALAPQMAKLHFFVPLAKGDAAFFAAWGLGFTAEDPLWFPSQGG